MNTNPEDKTASRLREAERERLFKLPDFPSERSADEIGVLLSDRIKHYCLEYKLIDPFEPKFLRPAGYDLRVGRNYSICGERRALDDGMKLKIKPYQVAVIETYETLNIPQFLIGRWNIRVQLAYKGLLWVGGAQVDPGFRGYLCCPIYNLSTKAVELEFRQKLAMIDFVTTTPFAEAECERFDWRGRGMLVFADYPPLSSGIEEEVNRFEKTIITNKEAAEQRITEANDRTQKSISNVGLRIDNFLTLIFTVVAVLFAGLGIVATTNSGERSFINLPVWVAAAALYFALQAHSSSEKVQRIDKWYARRGVALAIVLIVVVFCLTYHAWDVHVSTQKAVASANEQASRAVNDLQKERRDREAAVQQLRQESDAKLANAIQQLKLSQPTPPRTK